MIARVRFGKAFRNFVKIGLRLLGFGGLTILLLTFGLELPKRYCFVALICILNRRVDRLDYGRESIGMFRSGRDFVTRGVKHSTDLVLVGLFLKEVQPTVPRMPRPGLQSDGR